MFLFSGRKPQGDFSAVAIDMHSHLIPGVDDGPIKIANSITLIAGLRELGFQQLITTPHTLQEIHPNTSETLKNAYDSLSGQIPDGISLRLSSEYFMDEQFLEQLNSNALLPMPGNRLLLEFSQIARPHNLEEVVFDLGIRGYQVILAHPERYLFFHKQFNYFYRLKEMGVELQVNALSLTKYYGTQIQAIAEKLVDKEMIDFIGTDLHNEHQLSALKQVPQTKYFSKLVESGLLKNKLLAT